jgi:hypothetical protein
MASRDALSQRAQVVAAKPAVVDISQKPAIAKIVRQGFNVPVAALNTKQVEQFIGGLTPTKPQDVPRVLSQSIAPGTLVAVGAAVDLVLAPRTRIPFTVFQDLHAGFAGKNIADLEPLLSPQIKQTLLNHETTTTVPPAELLVLTTELKNKLNVTVNSNDPKEVENAFQTARNAIAFF